MIGPVDRNVKRVSRAREMDSAANCSRRDRVRWVMRRRKM